MIVRDYRRNKTQAAIRHQMKRSMPFEPSFPEDDMPKTKGKLLLYTRDKSPVDLEGMYPNGTVFLCLGGPSLKTHDLSLLQRRGIVTCAVNNAWTVVRPNFWVCVDPPQKFHDVGWRDPGIMKLMPFSHLRGQENADKKKFRRSLRAQVGKGVKQTTMHAAKMPNVYAYKRNPEFDPTTFLTENSVNWGQRGNRPDVLGHKGARSVMLAAIRLLYWLGFRTIFLLGCDFNMESGKQNYAFGQGTGRPTIRGNTRSYGILAKRFDALKPYFADAGLRICNCNPNSALESFPFMEYTTAVHLHASLGFYQGEDIRASGWYEKEDVDGSTDAGEEKN